MIQKVRCVADGIGQPGIEIFLAGHSLAGQGSVGEAEGSGGRCSLGSLAARVEILRVNAVPGWHQAGKSNPIGLFRLGCGRLERLRTRIDTSTGLVQPLRAETPIFRGLRGSCRPHTPPARYRRRVPHKFNRPEERRRFSSNRLARGQTEPLGPDKHRRMRRGSRLVCRLPKSALASR